MTPLESTNSIKPATLSRRNTASPSHAHLKATAWWNASTGVSATCCRPPVSPHPMNWLRRSNIMNGFTTTAFPRKHWDTKPLFKHSRNGRKSSQIYSKRKYMIYRDLTITAKFLLLRTNYLVLEENYYGNLRYRFKL